MPISLQSHAFAGNPLKSKTPKPTHPLSPALALETLKTQLVDNSHQSSSLNFKVLPFRKGRPLASSTSTDADLGPKWHLGWISLADCTGLFSASGVEFTGDSLLYLGSSSEQDVDVVCFIELRTLMVATDWADEQAMVDLAVAGHAKALLEWHNISRFCGYCGEKTVPTESGRRKQCSNELCRRKVYPRVDPVVIMLVVDRENDRALLGRQSRFVPRMWSCLAGFIEPGESLEEAVRRETWEETAIEVGEVMYHSSQPWPVGPSSMPCQLMVGFFAFAKSLEIKVDKAELEDAQWHSREDVRKALMFAEYEKAQRTAAAKVDQMCKGQSSSSDFNVESGELAPMFFPGPFAIAHRLITSWTTLRPVKVCQPLTDLSNAGLKGQIPNEISKLEVFLTAEGEKRAASFKINLFLVTIDDLLKRNRILKEVVVCGILCGPGKAEGYKDSCNFQLDEFRDL
ncbi:nudix hydrolase 19 [Populus alba x Populus x berolinensis]|uniref:NAD(+) diphosphatase n=1 Tax=Populus alba x Populus x berolinensis TaxID=444605 RepID=A0AAD6QNV3_9ROSI|nr:nudix hydrolase 19 [Populus alba x Populus x berolinensis]